MKSSVKIVNPPGGLLDGLLSDFRWYSQTGETLELSYSFAAPGSEFDQSEYRQESPNPTTDALFRDYTDKEKAIVRAVIAELETVANIRFSEQPDAPTSDIRFGISNVGDLAAYAFLPAAAFVVSGAGPPGPHQSQLKSGDIWLGFDVAEPYSTEAFFRATIVHELGHALGLSHPHQGFYTILDRENPVRDALILSGGEFDQYRFTVMSYNAVARDDLDQLVSGESANTSFSQLDIRALQFLYGASEDSGDDIFLVGDITADSVRLQGLPAARVHEHDNLYVGIGDGGGVNSLVVDIGELDAVISLVPGSWSNTGGGAQLAGRPRPFDNLWLAESARIVNLLLGEGDDLVYDSAADHRVMLGAGDDTFAYLSGNDRVDGEAGSDLLRFADPVSRYQFSTGDNGVVYVKELTGGDRLTLIDVEQLAFAEDRLLSTTDILPQLQEANRRLLQEDVALYQSSVSREEGEAISAQQAQLYRTYFGAVNRAPDEAGYEWWLERLEEGEFQFNEVADRFIDSPEFRGLADADGSGSIEDEEFLDHVYTTVFGRPPDAAGYAWWLDQLQTGQHNQGSAFTGMTQSDEFVLISAGTVSDFWLWGG